jgi:hypothetical protein
MVEDRQQDLVAMNPSRATGSTLRVTGGSREHDRVAALLGSPAPDQVGAYTAAP